jgi:hypothetical protein
MFERDEILTGRHAGAAVTHHAIGWRLSQNLFEIVAQRCYGSKRPVFVQVSQKVMVHRTGNTSRDTVDRFDITTISFGSSSVEEKRIRTAHEPGNLVDIGEHLHPRRAVEFPRPGWFLTGRRRSSFGEPLREPAVEDGHLVVPHPPKQPPQTACVHA